MTTSNYKSSLNFLLAIRSFSHNLNDMGDISSYQHNILPVLRIPFISYTLESFSQYHIYLSSTSLETDLKQNLHSLVSFKQMTFACFNFCFLSRNACGYTAAYVAVVVPVKNSSASGSLSRLERATEPMGISLLFDFSLLSNPNTGSTVGMFRRVF